MPKPVIKAEKGTTPLGETPLFGGNFLMWSDFRHLRGGAWFIFQRVACFRA